MDLEGNAPAEEARGAEIGDVTPLSAIAEELPLAYISGKDIVARRLPWLEGGCSGPCYIFPQ